MSQDLPPQKDDAARDGGLEARLQRTILVAEDDADIRLMMSMLLGMKGYHVIEARDGQETLDVAEQQQPDIILMDLQLPRLNGVAVARSIRQSDALNRTPIIVVSAHDPARHRNLVLAAGCNAYVQKPIDFDRLDELIVSLLPQDS
ncbi:MAG TPA: response regulator [Pyrinomonadaceae bacterium]|jgi:chemosensory pili system protein ChpA (sensor histidine kinase/response regulator)|nr:response regulator [Pyrinomonadaceae bacterium]